MHTVLQDVREEIVAADAYSKPHSRAQIPVSDVPEKYVIFELKRKRKIRSIF